MASEAQVDGGAWVVAELEALEEDQLGKIGHLRQALKSDDLEQFPVAKADATLYRFLKARKWDVEKAREMLEAHFQWRRQTFPISRDEFVNDAFFRAGSVQIVGTQDKKGFPLILINSGRFPVKQRDLKKVQRGIVFLMTHLAIVHGPDTRYSMLYDREGFSLSENLDKELMREMGKIQSDNFPETLEKCMVHPCGFVLRSIWKVVSLFFDADTRNKIVFLGSTDGFKNQCDDASLPAHLGGQLEGVVPWPEDDDDACQRLWDEFCSSLPEQVHDNWKEPAN